MKLLTTLAVAAGLLAASGAALAADADAAQATLKNSACTKCHAVDKKKTGPAFKDVAKKYKGKGDAESVLTKHVTTTATVEVDGQKEDHKPLKTKDAAEIKNLVQWILSL